MRPDQQEIIINCVDGETVYCMISPYRADLLAFLRAHDHEGSSLTLRWREGDGSIAANDNSEWIYSALGAIHD